jgi:hypothetical protein
VCNDVDKKPPSALSGDDTLPITGGRLDPEEGRQENKKSEIIQNFWLIVTISRSG